MALAAESNVTVVDVALTIPAASVKATGSAPETISPVPASLSD